MSNITFKMASIVTEQFATINKKIPENFIDVTTFDLQIVFGLSPENQRVACVLEINIKVEGEIIIILKVRMEFEIDNEPWESLLKTDRESINLPKRLLLHLATLTVGTMRGVLHTKTENTPYNQFLLPTVNLEELITGDQEFMAIEK